MSAEYMCSAFVLFVFPLDFSPNAFPSDAIPQNQQCRRYTTQNNFITNITRQHHENTTFNVAFRSDELLQQWKTKT